MLYRIDERSNSDRRTTPGHTRDHFQFRRTEIGLDTDRERRKSRDTDPLVRYPAVRGSRGKPNRFPWIYPWTVCSRIVWPPLLGNEAVIKRPTSTRNRCFRLWQYPEDREPPPSFDAAESSRRKMSISDIGCGLEFMGLLWGVYSSFLET